MKIEKSEEISGFEVLDVLFRAEGFSFGLEVLHGGLGINKFQFLIKKQDFFSCK
jgi:hypothetical protein